MNVNVSCVFHLHIQSYTSTQSGIHSVETAGETAHTNERVAMGKSILEYNPSCHMWPYFTVLRSLHLNW
jgi:hypothetical protein